MLCPLLAIILGNFSQNALANKPILTTLGHKKEGTMPTGPNNINQMHQLGKMVHHTTRVIPPVSSDAHCASSATCKKGNISLDASLFSHVLGVCTYYFSLTYVDEEKLNQ